MANKALADGFRERFFSVVEKGDQARVAGFAGINPSTISRWRTNAEPINLRFGTVEKLAEAVGKSPAWLLGLEPVEGPPAPSIDESTLFSVPLLRDRVAAGFPRAVDGKDVIAKLPFTRYWIRRKLGTVPGEGRLVLIRVDRGWLGESMLPTITSGSILLVDRGAGGKGLTSIEDGRVYLLSIDDGLTVKRVYNSDQELVCCPDNRVEGHRPFTVPLKDVRIQDVVKGRVIWVANQDV